jgi:hypothetical protein
MEHGLTGAVVLVVGHRLIRVALPIHGGLLLEAVDLVVEAA